MKFIITRTTLEDSGGLYVPPTDGATPTTSGYNFMGKLKEEPAFEIEIPDLDALLRLVDEVGTVIICNHDESTDIERHTIEIYDDYRE